MAKVATSNPDDKEVFTKSDKDMAYKAIELKKENYSEGGLYYQYCKLFRDHRIKTILDSKYGDE